MDNTITMSYDNHILYMCTHLYGQWTMFSCSTMHSQVHLIISQKEKVNYVIELSSERLTTYSWQLVVTENVRQWGLKVRAALAGSSSMNYWQLIMDGLSMYQTKGWLHKHQILWLIRITSGSYKQPVADSFGNTIMIIHVRVNAYYYSGPQYDCQFCQGVSLAIQLVC